MGYLGMKRGREGKADTIISIANCLMLLSHTNEFDSVKSDSPSRVFECKTCNRKFPSFQALGGHRASHKKPRLIESELTQSSPVKPKTHECSVCGLEFAMGQALGGHMRRHRVNATSDTESSELTQSPWRLPSMKRNSENSEMGMCLDLNLTPMENVDLDFQIGKVTPTVHYFL